MTVKNGTETDCNEISNPLQKAIASMMSPAIAIVVGQTVLKMLDDLPFLIRQEKIVEIQKKLDRIKKRHNKRRFTMMQAKRSCKEHVTEQNKH